MGIFDFFFGKKPEWLLVSEENINTDGPLNKSDAKKFFAMYLDQCGFDKEDIREEKAYYAEVMDENEDDFKTDIELAKEDLKETKQKLAKLKKTKKNDQRENFSGEDLQFKIESMQEEIEDIKESIEENQQGLKELKKDWKSHLIEYINQRAREESE